MQQLPKVLLVEDDRSIASAITYALQSSYDIEVAGTGQLALSKALIEDYEIIVLDLNLPDTFGLNVCQQMRDRGINCPILILSGESRTLTKINLLDAGANDYLTKPFSLGELKARMRVLIRSGRTKGRSVDALSSSGVWLNRQTFEVSRDGKAISLRRKEFALLECLLENAGSVVSRDVLVRSAWQGNDELWTNTIDVHIKHLRDKIDRPFEWHLIRTVHGRGYKLEVESPKVAEAVN